MMGVAVDVAVRLKPDTIRQVGLAYISELKVRSLLAIVTYSVLLRWYFQSVIMEYYTTTIFMSKSPVPVQARVSYVHLTSHILSMFLI